MAGIADKRQARSFATQDHIELSELLSSQLASGQLASGRGCVSLPRWQGHSASSQHSDRSSPGDLISIEPNYNARVPFRFCNTRRNFLSIRNMVNCTAWQNPHHRRAELAPQTTAANTDRSVADSTYATRDNALLHHTTRPPYPEHLAQQPI